jgi:6-pyruvoyltetrahydropterin/6-carboxytetrahydropterin synthase
MPTIGKDFTFEAAHRLQNHDGKCRNLHGHSYKAQVSVTGERLQESGPQEGMLFDFGVLNEWWKSAGEPMLDHMTILEHGDPLIGRLAGEVMMNVVDWPPTAENLSVFIAQGLWSWLAHHVESNGFLVKVKVYETEKSWAEGHA